MNLFSTAAAVATLLAGYPSAAQCASDPPEAPRCVSIASASMPMGNIQAFDGDGVGLFPPKRAKNQIPIQSQSDNLRQRIS